MKKLSKLQRQVFRMVAEQKPFDDGDVTRGVIASRENALSVLRKEGYVCKNSRRITEHGRIAYMQLTGKPMKPIETEPDYGHCCEVCGSSPVVPMTGMCGPCTFGEAGTAVGNW
jgi:hypothetical protein